MSNTAKIATGVLAAILLIIVLYVTMGSDTPSPTVDASDQSLQQDTTAIDAELSGLEQDRQVIDQELSDAPAE